MSVVHDTQTRIEVLTEVPLEVAEEFLAIYRTAFAPLAAKVPARQALTDDEFREEMADPSVVKYAVTANGDVQALAFMATDLAMVPWISVPYFEARFPEHMARKAVYYFGALLVRPDVQGGPFATRLLKELVLRCAEDQAVAAFDCCAFNVTEVRLSELIAAVARRHSVVETLELDRQHYYAYVVSGHR